MSHTCNESLVMEFIILGIEDAMNLVMEFIMLGIEDGMKA